MNRIGNVQGYVTARGVVTTDVDVTPAVFPSTLPGLKLWTRADLGITLTSQKVTKWADQSGAGNDLNALVAAAPLFVASSPNMQGGSSLRWSGIEQMATAAGFTNNQPCTIIVVAKYSSLAGNLGIIDNPTIRQIGYVAAAGPNWAMDAGVTLTSAAAADEDLHTFVFVFDGATSFLYIDSAQPPVLAGDAGAHAGTGGFLLGTQSTAHFIGEISEVVICDGVLSPSLISQFCFYVAQGRPQYIPPSMLAMEGNSIVAGYAASPLTDGFADATGRSFPSAQFNNAGLAGQTTPQMTIAAPIDTDPFYAAVRPQNVVMALEVTNDYNSGSTAAQCIAHLATWVAARKAAGWNKVGIYTVLPSYVFADVPGGLADLATINAAIRAKTPGNDICSDIAAQPIMGNVANINDPRYYVGRLHPTNLGHQLITPISVASVATALPLLA